MAECNACGGSGVDEPGRCARCNGDGWVSPDQLPKDWYGRPINPTPEREERRGVDGGY